MFSFRNLLKFIRVVLILALLGASFQAANAQLSWKRETPDATPAPSQQQQAEHTTDRHADHTMDMDRQVAQTEFQEAPTADVGSPVEDYRLLSPPTRDQIAAPAESGKASTSRKTTLALPRIESFATAGSGLAIVVGLFLVCVWLLRRSGPKPTAPLPSEAVAVLGRVPLAARNFAHLLQVGNKLVLVAMTPEGVSPITEITDPVEVQRLLGLCQSNRKQSTTAEFHDVLEKLSKEPTSGFLGNEVATTYAKQSR